mgnify:CR=1 FL=1
MAYLSGAFPLHFLNQRDNSAVCGYGRAFNIFICVLCRRIRCPIFFLLAAVALFCAGCRAEATENNLSQLHFVKYDDMMGDKTQEGYGRAFNIFICVLCRRIRCPPDLSNLFLICTICTVRDSAMRILGVQNSMLAVPGSR